MLYCLVIIMTQLKGLLMSHFNELVDHYTRITDTLAISGQPSVSQIADLRDAGVQMIVHLKIKGLDSVIPDEQKAVEETGLLYEVIPVSFNDPTQEAYQALADVLQEYQTLNILLHCHAGYCTSGMLIPYLVNHHNQLLEDATAQVIINQFNPQWDQFIEQAIASSGAK